MGDGERGGWSRRALRNAPQGPLAGRRWLRAPLSLLSPLQPVWDTSAMIWSFTGRPPSKRCVFQSAEGRGKGNLLPAASNVLCRGLRQLKELGKRGADPTRSLWLPCPPHQVSQRKPGQGWTQSCPLSYLHVSVFSNISIVKAVAVIIRKYSLGDKVSALERPAAERQAHSSSGVVSGRRAV